LNLFVCAIQHSGLYQAVINVRMCCRLRPMNVSNFSAVIWWPLRCSQFLCPNPTTASPCLSRIFESQHWTLTLLHCSSRK